MNRFRNLRALLLTREFVVFMLLVLSLVSVGVVNPRFLSRDNLRDMLVGDVQTIIPACGMTFVILLGEIDISVGSMLGVLATVLGKLTSPSNAGWSVGAGVTATLLLGLGLGTLNGLLVAYGAVPSIIATLGMLTILAGLNQLVMNGNWIIDLPPGLRYLGTGAVGGIPVSVLTMLAVVAACGLYARYTAAGRHLYAVGSNAAAAVTAGLPVRRIKVRAFALTGLLMGVAAVVTVPHLSVIESGIGQGLELRVVTCVVVGGASVNGGRGSIMGTVLAALLLGLVGPMLIFLKLGPSAVYWERAIQGAFILAAVLADHIGRRRRAGVTA